jgi:hypothetical protein
MLTLDYLTEVPSMPRTRAASSGENKPAKRATPWLVPPSAEERVRICIRAAELRARAVSYKEIAAELGLESPLAAKKCAETGYGLAPGEDLRMARRRAADELDLIRQEAWKIIDNPGYATTVTGKLVLVPDPETGIDKPQPDQMARNAALNTLKGVNAEYRKLHGTDAPRQTVSVVATAPLEELQAAVEHMRAEVAEAERQAAMDAFRGPDDDGPLALPAGTG